MTELFRGKYSSEGIKDRASALSRKAAVISEVASKKVETPLPPLKIIKTDTHRVIMHAIQEKAARIISPIIKKAKLLET